MEPGVSPLGEDLLGLVLVGALRPDPFVLLEFDLEIGGRDSHQLLTRAHQVHLDSAVFRVPQRPMREGVQVERATQLVVDPPEQVAVERGGHLQGIVVGQLQCAWRLDQIRPDQ